MFKLALTSSVCVDVSEGNIPIAYPYRISLTAATEFPQFFLEKCFPRPETYYDNEQITSIHKIMICNTFEESYRGVISLGYAINTSTNRAVILRKLRIILRFTFKMLFKMTHMYCSWGGEMKF